MQSDRQADGFEPRTLTSRGMAGAPDAIRVRTSGTAGEAATGNRGGRGAVPRSPRTLDSRYDSVKTMLTDKYNGVIPVTDEMVQAVLDELDEEG